MINCTWVRRIASVETVPWLTICTALLCSAVTKGFLSAQETDLWVRYSTWGSPPPSSVWNGAIYVPITSAFLHSSWIHLIEDLIWFCPSAIFLETAISRRLWIGLFIMATYVSYSAGLAIHGLPCHGLSAVGFAFFGFIAGANRRLGVVPRTLLIVFLVGILWMVYSTCVDLTDFIWDGRISLNSNVVHLAGLVLGVSVSVIRYVYPKGFVIIVLPIVLIVCLPIVWAPWQRVWLETKAVNAYKAEKFDRAENLYLKSLNAGADSEWVWASLMYVYAAKKDASQYSNALDHLRKINGKVAVQTDQILHGLIFTDTNLPSISPN